MTQRLFHPLLNQSRDDPVTKPSGLQICSVDPRPDGVKVCTACTGINPGTGAQITYGPRGSY